MADRIKIDLDNYRDPDVFVFSGRDRGEALRKKINLEKLESENAEIEVVISDKIFSINASFILGLFGISVRNLHETGFRSKYHFTAREILIDSINRGIKEALKESIAIPNT
jgi:hypothetical protein